MSTITLMWDDLKIMEINKRGDLFFSKIDYDNIMKAKENGFPIALLKQVSVVSDELSPIIKRRIPNPEKLRKRINFKNNDENDEIERAICEYINETKCRRPTDKFSIKLEINN